MEEENTTPVPIPLGLTGTRRIDLSVCGLETLLMLGGQASELQQGIASVSPALRWEGYTAISTWVL